MLNVFFEINLNVIFNILFDFKKEKVIFFTEKKYLTLIHFLNKYLGYKISFQKFDISKIYVKEMNIRPYTINLSDKLSKNITKSTIENDCLLKKISKEIGQRSFFHAINYLTWLEVQKLLLFIETSKYFFKDKVKIYINSEHKYILSYLNNYYEFNTEIINIRNDSNFLYNFLIILSQNLLKKIFCFFLRFKKNENLINRDNSIISLQENNLHFSKDERSQLHWIEEQENFFFNYIIKDTSLKNEKKNSSIYSFLENQKLKKKIGYILNKNLIYSLPNNDLVNQKIKFLIKDIYFEKKIITNNFIYLKIIKILFYSIFLSNLFKKINFKIFLYSHFNYDVSSFFFLKKFIDFKIINYQYTHISRPNPLLISPSDFYLSFSNTYENLIKTDENAPEKFINVGYLHENIYLKLMIKKKKFLEDHKQFFKIGLLDERVDESIWGTIKIQKHKIYLNKVIEFTLKNKDIILLNKSQFSKYSPSKLLVDNENFKELLNQGRFFDLRADEKNIKIRNSILPMELGICSDIIISEKFGLTAAVECANIGTRVVVLDKYNWPIFLDNKFKDMKIQFSSIEKILVEILRYKNNLDKKNDILGNWFNIIDNFSSRNIKSDDFGRKNIFRNSLKDILDNS